MKRAVPLQAEVRPVSMDQFFVAFRAELVQATKDELFRHLARSFESLAAPTQPLPNLVLALHLPARPGHVTE